MFSVLLFIVGLYLFVQLVDFNDDEDVPKSERVRDMVVLAVAICVIAVIAHFFA